MKKVKNKKTILILVICFLIIIVGYTIAVFSGLVNVPSLFSSDDFNLTINDKFVSPLSWKPGDFTKKEFSVTNRSKNDVAVRLSFYDEWKTSNGDILNNIKDNKEIASLIYGNILDWVYADDGYYYYIKKLGPGETTSDFIKGLKFNDYVELDDENCFVSDDGNTLTCQSSGDSYDDATYTIYFHVEMTQFATYKSSWNSNFDINDEVPDDNYNLNDFLVDQTNPDDTNYEEGNINSLYAFNHEATGQTSSLIDYRFIGNNPYNYIYFNCLDENDEATCELWRIIGIFDVEDEYGNHTQKMKIMRESSFGNYSWKPKYFEQTWLYNSPWIGSNFENILNKGEFYNTLSNSSKNMISNSKFYLGEGNNSMVSAEDFYNVERSTTTRNNYYLPYSFDDIALIYGSDYAYTFANGVNDNCFNDITSCYQTSTYYSMTSWMYNLFKVSDEDNDNSVTFVLTPYNYDNYNFRISGWGRLRSNNYTYIVPLWPTLYLNSTILYESGDGSLLSPFKVKLNSYNITVDNNLVNVKNSEYSGKYVTLNMGEKYTINSFKVNGEVVSGDAFLMPLSDVTITDVNYTQVKYDIINQDNIITIPRYGAPDETIELNSDKYEISSFKLDGNVISGHTFLMPSNNVTISDIQYTQVKYDISCNDDSIEFTKYGASGENINLDSDLYRINSFKVNGTLVNGTSFVMPNSDVTISDISKDAYIIVESEHYPCSTHSYDDMYENTFDGASSITVVLTYSLPRNSSYYISLYSSSYSLYNQYKSTSSLLTTETITIPSNYLKIQFNTGGSNYYGFRARIIPNY